MAANSGKLPREFYRRPTLEVARELLGKEFVVQQQGVSLAGRIVETEAYIGVGDPACHARFGRTKRNSIMFGDGGFAYVYFIYGMYNMLNFVTEPEGSPAAVLIRALEPVAGIKVMSRRRRINSRLQLTSGPGKLCQAFGITVEDTGRDLVSSEWFVRDRGYRVDNIETSSRIGIRTGTKHQWRFFDADSEFVSLRTGRSQTARRLSFQQ
jgi:DNA-3-methyladenine glycosylase